MKILVFADSHTDVGTMLYINEQEKPDSILHLGDHITDATEFKRKIEIPLYCVKGNTDGDLAGDEELCLTLDNISLYMSHGHLHQVDNGLSSLISSALNKGAAIALYGHTHTPFISYIGGIWVMNPGRIGRISSKVIHATYGIITAQDRSISCQVKEVKL